MSLVADNAEGSPDVYLSDLIAPSFHLAHEALKYELFTHYWLKGGRGSAKSCFTALEIIQGIINDPEANGLCMRKVADTLRGSCHQQLEWAMFKLGVRNFFKVVYNPLYIEYLPTEQKIYFRGLDNPQKLKSITLSRGRFKYLWFEELAEFSNLKEIDSVKQSILRGAGEFVCFYTYNPPQYKSNWVNQEAKRPRKDRLVLHTTYLTVPKDWLGKIFITEAEDLRDSNERRYRHEYLGEDTGTGGEVFDNVVCREITDEEIDGFEYIRQGLDWGYSADPFCFIKLAYDRKRRKIFIFDEIFQVKLLNREATIKVKEKSDRKTVTTADSAEPKSIADLKSRGVFIRGAKKGKDSINHGIKFLQDQDEIVIDPNRCPNAAREFTSYELKQDKDGNFIADYPDKENHTIDAVRYALENDMLLKVSILDVIHNKKR